MQDIEFINGLLDFIKNSPTPFHAVNIMAEILERAGFQRLHEADKWSLQERARGTGYYVIRNHSSLIAFRLHNEVVENGIRMIGAHTDSPCLKLKPEPEVISNNYLQLGVEVYGGALLNPWFDRDLSLAGRVNFLNEDGAIDYQLVNLEKAIAVIPSLAIHLDREVNNNRSIDAQKHLPPVLMKLPDGETRADFRDILLKLINSDIQGNSAQPHAVKILDYELSFYDVQPPAVIGLHDDFIAGARLDNLLSCYTGLIALLNSDGMQNALLVCSDHEEVGSVSAAGARGPFLNSVLHRMCDNEEDYSRMVSQSTMISADNAHGIHPNYADKHDANHGPILNNGPVIKINANQRYASNSETSALFKYLCELADVPVQSFVMRSDMACGSTIGPITASETGIKTVDVGVPSFAMHSVREIAGRWDTYYLYRVLKQFYS